MRHAILLLLLFITPAAAADPPNVLFIAVDDLRPQLGCYGEKWMKTPHIDKLSESGIRFDKHYVQFAVCIPSRVALLTGLRSERTHQVYGPMEWQKVPGATPLARHFTANGYITVSLGKIWHAQGEPSGDKWDEEWHPKAPDYADPALNPKDKRPKKVGDAPPPPFSDATDVADDYFRDGKTAAAAVDRIGKLAKGGKPFFLAVGFHKPHLPHSAPKKYWNLYDRASLPLPASSSYPDEAPGLARNHGIKNFSGLPTDPHKSFTEAQTRHVIHGYAACTSYTDSQVGVVLTALRENGLDKSTIVVLWGDHGWHLGELDQWAKSTNFERATRSPLIVSGPGVKRGASCNQLVETVDILPTLCELCRIPSIPAADGQSFSPLLANPSQTGKPAVYHCFDRPAGQAGTDSEGKRLVKGKEPVIGYAVRTRDARYIEWHKGWGLDTPVLATEFYRYTANRPDEAKNEVEDPALRSEVAEHKKLLRKNPAFMPIPPPRSAPKEGQP